MSRKKTSQARKQRRLYESYIKKFHPTQHAEYKKNSIERGKKIHESNVESRIKAEEALFEARQTKMIQKMRDEGKTNEEIDSFIEDWVRTIKVWGSAEKPINWRKIRSEKLQNSSNK